MTQIFQVLFKLWYSNGYITFAAIAVTAQDETEAELKADQVIQSDGWSEVSEYQIEQVSRNPFYIKKWNVRLSVSTFPRPEKPQIQFIRVGATDAQTAAETAVEIVAARKGVVNVEPLETLPYDPNP